MTSIANQIDARIRTSTLVVSAVKTKPSNAGKGRVKGVPNRISGDLREMVRAALEGAGGVDYLIVQAERNPTAFLSLVAKLIPTQVAADFTLHQGLAERLHALRERGLNTQLAPTFHSGEYPKILVPAASRTETPYE